MASSDHRRTALLQLLLIGVVGFAAYANALSGEFLYDDEFFIQRNRYITDCAYLKDIFTTDLTAGAYRPSNFYRPVQSLAYMAVYVFSGYKVLGYHLLNVLLHVGNAALVYLLTARLFASPLAAFAASLLFVVHPVHTSAVAYISGTADPLACFFVLLALLAWLRDSRALSVASFVLALLSKEVAMILPMLMLVVDVFRRKPIRWGRYLPHLGVAAVYALARLTVLNFTGTLNPYGEPNLYTQHPEYRLFTFLASLGEYFKVLLAPLDLQYDRAQVIFTSFWVPPVVLPCVAALAVTYLAWRSWKAGRRWLLGWAWFLVALCPVSGILLPINGFAKEHWLYVPSIGYFLLAGYGLSRLTPAARVALLVPLAVWWSGLTVVHNRTWQNPVAFYTDVLKHNPDIGRVHNNLAMAYTDQGRLDLAERHYRQAVALEDVYAETRYNLGRLYLQQRRLDEALAQFSRALELEPDFIYAHQTLQQLYTRLGRGEDARREAKRVQEIMSKPSSPKKP